jgi:hypothetical protein
METLRQLTPALEETFGGLHWVSNYLLVLEATADFLLSLLAKTSYLSWMEARRYGAKNWEL